MRHILNGVNHLKNVAMKKLITAFLGLTFTLCAAQAQDVDIFELSLEDLLNTEVSVASQKSLSQRESPGIITVLTEEDIRLSGARDLIDVLRLVPSFEFGFDVEGVVGIGVRGNWAHEGKALLLIDGMEANELLYSTTQFGNHYPVTAIKKIEIMRGPGTAIYGGNAELTVISVFLKGDSPKVFDVNATYGQLEETMGRANFSLSTGYAISEKMHVKFNAFAGKGVRSGKDITDYAGTTYSMKDGSALDPMMVNFQIKYSELKIKFLADLYSLESKDYFGMFMSNEMDPIRFRFHSYLGEVSNTFKLSDKAKLQAKYNLMYQKPWSVPDDEVLTYLDETSPNYFPDAEYSYDKRPEKHTFTLNSNVDFSENFNVILGVSPSYFRSTGHNDRSYYYDEEGNVHKSVDYYTVAVYAQSIYNTKFANITAGVRFEDHNQVGGAFVPRIGITRTFNNLHVKALFSQAFRTPSIENIELNKDIKPEKTTVFEVEAGYVLNKNMFFNLNLFDISISKPIVYSVTAEGEELYENLDKTGTKGLEIDYRIRGKWGYTNLAYSYYNSDGKNKVGLYEVPSKPNILLGFPNHKATLLSQFRIGKSFSINPSITYMSERYGVTDYDFDTDEPTISSIDPIALFNFYLLYDNLFTKGISLGAGVYDLLNAEYSYIQPYSGIHPPIHSGGREIIVKLSYRIQ